MSSTGTSLDNLNALIDQDIAESNNLQASIDQLKSDIASDAPSASANALSDLETQGKKLIKDLVRRVEELDDRPDKDAADRTYLQTLNRRLAIFDTQMMQMAEIRDLRYKARGGKFDRYGNPVEHDFLEPERVLGKGEKVRGWKRKVDVGVPKPAAEPKRQEPLDEAKEPVPSPVSSPSSEVPGPSMVAVAEPIDPRDIGAAEYASEGHQHIHDDEEGGDDDDDEYVYEDEDDNQYPYEQEEEEQEPEVEKSNWPLCYRILDVDPNTEPYYFKNACDK